MWHSLWQGALDLIIHKFHERTPGQVRMASFVHTRMHRVNRHRTLHRHFQAASLRMLVPEQVQAGLALALGGIVQATGVQVGVLDCRWQLPASGGTVGLENNRKKPRLANAHCRWFWTPHRLRTPWNVPSP